MEALPKELRVEELRIMNYALTHIERWRHIHGYGVHSPMAYRIVKDCIRHDSKYAFYSDAYLDFEYHEDRKGLKNAKMALRLINLIRPRRIWIPIGDKRLCTALKISFPKIHLATQKECPKNVDFIICNGMGDCNEIWGKMKAHPECGMLVFGKELDSMEDATLIMNAKDFTIILRREGMDFVCYPI